MMNMMPMFFVLKTKLKNFLFENLNIQDIQGLIIACLCVFLVTALYEALKLIQLYFQLRVRQDPLTYAKTDNSTSDRSVLLTPFLIPVNIQQIRKQRLKFHFYGCLSHMVNLSLAYFIMLAVMTYNVWLGLSVLIGAATGYHVFGAVGVQVTSKFTKVAAIKRLNNEDTNISTQATDPVPDNCHI
ncbi:hypothetical protein LOTGIDRAFT_162356 [Lottia gigantea]|uniref:Copper transport protein n=1 Tax=Lottia gigantea TaxID=225164 RepID=V4ACS4_LOTGI|nr:hypothetical protein LOTGIDRAFT_162356 [Lottia gigantea]ESO92880.1 hypothetical protein LOTGIDRAFT_162356 [Lottia gigantea]